MNKYVIIVGIAVILIGVFIARRNTFVLPDGDTAPFQEIETEVTKDVEGNSEDKNQSNEGMSMSISQRTVLTTDGVKHSIPLDEIQSGGPGKDGIPSIDNPVFIEVDGANNDLADDAPGIGLVIEGDARFYPYSILVWHEIVNDIVGGINVVVTYCPLCATGVVYDRGDYEFGVSGLLWESNLLMYNRAKDADAESLWSQVLGEAVLGIHTGETLSIIESDIIRYHNWVTKHPQTKILSRDTGSVRPYGRDPYDGYYDNDASIFFPVSTTDNRFDNKDLVLGVEFDGVFKAYRADDISEGISTDTINKKELVLKKDTDGSVRITHNGVNVPYVPGFWFSWVAVHPDTLIYTQ